MPETKNTTTTKGRPRMVWKHTYTKNYPSLGEWEILTNWLQDCSSRSHDRNGSRIARIGVRMLPISLEHQNRKKRL